MKTKQERLLKKIEKGKYELARKYLWNKYDLNSFFKLVKNVVIADEMIDVLPYLNFYPTTSFKDLMMSDSCIYLLLYYLCHYCSEDRKFEIVCNIKFYKEDVLETIGISKLVEIYLKDDDNPEIVFNIILEKLSKLMAVEVVEHLKDLRKIFERVPSNQNKILDIIIDKITDENIRIIYMLSTGEEWNYVKNKLLDDFDINIIYELVLQNLLSNKEISEIVNKIIRKKDNKAIYNLFSCDKIPKEEKEKLKEYLENCKGQYHLYYLLQDNPERLLILFESYLVVLSYIELNDKLFTDKEELVFVKQKLKSLVEPNYKDLNDTLFKEESLKMNK